MTTKPPPVPPGSGRASVRLGLTIGAGARLLGVDIRTWERWEQGNRSVPPPVVRLLWALERDPSLLDALRQMAA